MVLGTNIHLIDLLIIGGYLALCLIIGISKLDKVKTLRDYTLGGKQFPTMLLVATIFATSISAQRSIGIVEKSYSLGLVFIVPLLLYPVSWFILSRLLASNYDLFRKQKFMTLSDVMEYWYGKLGRWVANICAIVVAFGITAISIIAIGYLFHHFLGIDRFYGSLIAVAVITSYSVLGGVQAVVITDFFQFLIFFIALPIACAIGIAKAGGGGENAYCSTTEPLNYKFCEYCSFSGTAFL